MSEAPPSTPAPAAARPARTCVGCGEVAVVGGPDAPLLRVVVHRASENDPWECVVDAPASLGRGMWLHPAPKCLARALRGGFSKSMKGRVDLAPEALAEAGIRASERALEGILAAGRRSRKAVYGADACRELLAREPDALLVVATDAGAIARTYEVAEAVRLGRAVAWADKRRLGVFFGKEEVALVAIADPRMSVAIVRAITDRAAFAACSVELKRPESPAKPTMIEGDGCTSPEVR